MQKTEFEIFINRSVRAAIPQLAKWLRDNPETYEFWFNEFFSGMDLEICRQAVSRMMAEDGIKQYDFHLFPSKLLKIHSEVKWDAGERDREPPHHSRGAKKVLQDDPIMGPCLNAVLDQFPESKYQVAAERGKLRKQFISDYIDEECPDDETTEPDKYGKACGLCDGTGLVSVPGDAVLACKCGKGDRYTEWKSRGRDAKQWLARVGDPGTHEKAFDDFNAD